MCLNNGPQAPDRLRSCLSLVAALHWVGVKLPKKIKLPKNLLALERNPIKGHPAPVLTDAAQLRIVGAMTNDAPDSKAPEAPPPDFDGQFRETLTDLYLWRRDVRRFKTDPIEPALIEELIGLAALAPSVGNSQPWRFVLVEDEVRREAIRGNFEQSNAEALNDYHGEKARLYAGLKLSGMREAPVQLAVYADIDTDLGAGLGQRTMPETLQYSVVGAVQNLWLAARARGIGIGWVSILDPDQVAQTLDVPDSWKLVAYLCIGYPQEEHLDPELVRHGWQERVKVSEFIFKK